MWPFRRKPKGKHALGAAVTAIPGLPAVVPPTPVAQTPAAHVPAYAPPPVQPTTNAPILAAAPQPPELQEHRVELGFRDGSTAALAPGSAQAKALTEIASILTHRD